MKQNLLFHIILFLLTQAAFAQSASIEPVQNQVRIGGYISGVTHLFEFERSEISNSTNLLPLQSFGVPVGVNFWIEPKFAFSIEFVPEVHFQESLIMEKLLFHPGFIWNLSNRTSLATRLAFDTSGRIGFTPVLGYSLVRFDQSTVSLGIPFPLRFGNDLPPQFAVGLQLGWGF